MTTRDIVAADRRVQYSGSSGLGPYSFAFQLNATSELAVYIDSTLKTETTHYTVTLAAAGSGSITFASGQGPTALQTVTLVSNVPITRTSVYSVAGSLTAASLENDFDTNRIIAQQINEKAERSLHAPEHDPDDINMELPAKADRLSKVLQFDSSGEPIAVASLTDAATTTVPGLMSTADRTKLDGIEAGADVTDATNVNAAGAVMNSDTTIASMQFVVDEDNMSSDSSTKVPTQQSVKAYVDSQVQSKDALSELSGDLDDISDGSSHVKMTNAERTKLTGIEDNATSDQTDAEIKTAYENNSDTNAFTDAEKTKLTGIEAGATSDQTASEILTAIKTVDGTTSGLDADLLDGQEGSYYQQASTALTTSTSFGGDVSGTYNAIVIADDSHNHTISNVDGLQTAIDAKAPLASPALTGTPTAPTAAADTSTTQIATTAFVQQELAELVDSAPSTLDTLNEIAAAINDDPNFNTTVTNSLANRVRVDTSSQGLTSSQQSNARTNLGLSTVANTGAYSDLSGTPTIPTTLTDLTLDLNGNELILDLDGDTSITSDTDDEIHFKIGGADELTLSSSYLMPHTDRGLNLGAAGRIWLNMYADQGHFVDISISDQILSQVTTQAPMTVASTIKVANLNVDKLDDQEGSYYLNYNNFTNVPTLTTTLSALTDTTITSVGDNDLIAYDSSSSKFINQTPTEAGFATVATSGSYNDLSNTPTFPTVNNGTITLSPSTGIKINGDSFGKQFSMNQSTSQNLSITTDLSELDDMTQTMVNSDEFIVLDDGTNKRKAASEIPLSIFNNDSGFITSVPAQTFASLTNKPTTLSGYGITDAFDGAYTSLTGTPTVPTATSDLTNDSGFITSVPAQSFSSLTGKPTTISGYGITDAFDGAYGSLTGTPTIPSATSDLTNDSGFITSADGGNAQTLDSLDSTQFLRSDADDNKTSGNLTFEDNIKARFGTSGDLQIFHNGSNSIISELGTGEFQLQTNGTSIKLLKANTNEILANFIPDGSVDLYHDSELRFRTTSTGAKITGGTGDGVLIIEADTDNVTENDNALITLTQDGGIVAGTFGFDGQNNLFIKGTGSATNIQLMDDDELLARGIPQGAFELYHNNSLKISTTTDGGLINGDLTLTKSVGDTKLFIEADSDNNVEGDNAFLIYKLDGGVETAAIWAGNYSGNNDNSLNISNSTSVSGGIKFLTTNVDGGWETATERMRIATDGQISMFNDLTLTSTDAGATESPTLDLFRNSASPADDDALGNITFTGKDDNGDTLTYAQIQSKIFFPTNTNERGGLQLDVMQNGSLVTYVDLLGNSIALNRSTTVNNGDLTVTSTDDGSTENPTLDLYRNSASPADNDVLGHITFTGENDAGEKIQYAEIESRIIDASDGNEDGRLVFSAMLDGTNTNYYSPSFGSNIFFRNLFLSQSTNIVFEGSTDDANETTLSVIDPTSDNTVLLPDASGTVALQEQAYQAINAQTGTTYTTVLADGGKLVTLSNASAITLTIPPNSSVAYPVGTKLDFIQIGAGQVTVAGGTGVTVNSTPTLKFRAQHSGASCIKIATDTWQLVGDLAAS